MKFESSTNATNHFAEQLQNVIILFEQWSDCERAVSLFAVLKKLTFPGTKFIQSVIETNLQQSHYLDQAKILERNANSAIYINGLCESYRNFKCNDVQLTADSIFYESDRSLDKLDKVYDKKEEILLDILKMMPILTIGNDEAKKAYLEFIPIIIKDAIRRIVNVALVQQISSYVLIHPAFSTDDRKPLSEHLKHLENHIKTSNNDSNLDLYRNGPSPTSEPTKPSTPSNWQAIAPPSQSKSTETISWCSNHHPTTAYNDDKDYHKTIGGSTPKLGHFYESIADNDNSFLNNGKIVDNEDDGDTSNTQIGYNSLVNLTGNLNLFNRTTDSKRRTSLPTDTTNHGSSPKSRSYSLPSERHTNSVGYESLLNQYKATLPPTHNVGMSSIGAWLKDLRLHKYTMLFANKTYEQMLDITDEYLQERDVTQGARHKLVNCIQKLKKRHSLLCQLEIDLLANKITIGSAVEELKGIVLTPMKPVDLYNDESVAGQFIKVLTIACNMMAQKHVVPQDEEIVNQLSCILDRAAHHEAFVGHLHLLTEHRYKMEMVRKVLPSKVHRARHQYNLYQDFLEPKLTPRRHEARKIKSVPILPISRNPWASNSSHSLFNDHWKLPGNRTSENSFKSQRSATPKSVYDVNGSNSAYNKKWDYAHTNTNYASSEYPMRELYSKVAQNNSDVAQNINLMYEEISPFAKNALMPIKYTFRPPNNLLTTPKDSLIATSKQFKITNNETSEFKIPFPPPQHRRSSNEISVSRQSISSGYDSDDVWDVGMHNIKPWLKSLRLHKYTSYFRNLSYEEIFTFTEEYLIGRGITKGASHKLAICIEKLKTRIDDLKQMELNLRKNYADLPAVLIELKTIALTPMKPIRYHVNDVGYQFYTVLSLAFSIIVANNYDVQTIGTFMSIIDKSIESEAFLDDGLQLRNMKIRLNNILITKERSIDRAMDRDMERTNERTLLYK